MISINNLTRRYGDVVAVDRVSASIERGRVVGLLGHNGAGKTTVMKILTGYLEPTSGTIEVGGIDVTTDRPGVQRQIGYLPEEAPLYPEMLVQEYLLMMAELRGVPAGERVAAVAAAARATSLLDHLVRPVSELSKGYRQRVGIAQAIVHNPAVLVLDEPTNGLDPMQIEAIRELIRELGKRTTIILSTHILQEVEAVCDRVLIMIQGAVAADANMAELLESDRVRITLSASSDPAGVRSTLASVAGVAEVLGMVERDGWHDWTVRAEAGANPVAAIVDAGSKAGWTFGGIAQEQRTLETVFKDLQKQHIAQQGVAA